MNLFDFNTETANKMQQPQVNTIQVVKQEIKTSAINPNQTENIQTKQIKQTSSYEKALDDSIAFKRIKQQRKAKYRQYILEDSENLEKDYTIIYNAYNVVFGSRHLLKEITFTLREYQGSFDYKLILSKIPTLSKVTLFNQINLLLRLEILEVTEDTKNKESFRRFVFKKATFNDVMKECAAQKITIAKLDKIKNPDYYANKAKKLSKKDLIIESQKEEIERLKIELAESKQQIKEIKEIRKFEHPLGSVDIKQESINPKPIVALESSITSLPIWTEENALKLEKSYKKGMKIKFERDVLEILEESHNTGYILVKNLTTNSLHQFDYRKGFLAY